MKLKKLLSFTFAVALTLSLAACGSGSAVYVQSVEQLSNVGGIAPGDRFAGIVVSENVTEIKKDDDKTIAELYVKSGDDVKTGQKLFSYDVEELQLTLDKQRLEQEQLEASIENYKSQIEELQKQYQRAGTRDKLQYSVQIQTYQVDQKEAELNLKTKEAEVKKSEELLENSTVVSPVDGRIQQISETGTDSNGNAVAYITIQQAGAYRVKGTLGELQRGGIVEGDRIRIISRTDSAKVWMGTVTLVDYENPSQGNQNSYYDSGSDEMTSGSRYPFYVALDSSDDLLLGQHVYLELDTGDGESSALKLSSAFIAYDDDGNPYVWAEKGHKLEKRSVTLGEYNEMQDTYEITDGLTAEDYIAYPDENTCIAGASTTHTEIVSTEDTESEESGVE